MKTLFLIAALFSSISAFAQGGGGTHVGGGRFTEALLKDFMGELANYFSEAESIELFPEVKTYNETHTVSFSDFIRQIEPVVVDHKVYGPFGEERDCVSMIKDGRKWFECNSERIPENRIESQPLLYIILLHEAMVQAGIEKPESETVPSKYPVSSRIGNGNNLSLVTYQKYIPRRRSNPCLLRYIAPEGGGFDEVANLLMKKGFILDRNINSRARYTFELDIFVMDPGEMRSMYTAYLSQEVSELLLRRTNFFFAEQKQLRIMQHPDHDTKFKELVLKKIQKIPACSLTTQPKADPNYSPRQMLRFYTETEAGHDRVESKRALIDVQK